MYFQRWILPFYTIGTIHESDSSTIWRLGGQQAQPQLLPALAVVRFITVAKVWRSMYYDPAVVICLILRRRNLHLSFQAFHGNATANHSESLQVMVVDVMAECGARSILDETN